METKKSIEEPERTTTDYNTTKKVGTPEKKGTSHKAVSEPTTKVIGKYVEPSFGYDDEDNIFTDDNIDKLIENSEKLRNK